MPLRPSVADSGWPASPSIGRPPDDPYYKLARHAAIESVQRHTARPHGAIATASEAASRAVLPGVLGNISSVAQMLSQVGKLQPALGYVTEVSDSTPISGTLTPAPSVGPSVAPIRTEGDSLVASDQADSEAWLQLVAPSARVEFKLAKDRIQVAADAIGVEQAGFLAQGLESLRRAMNKLADRLFPPVSGKVENSFGDELVAHDRAYINRLHLALDDSALRKGLRRLEKAELEDFHRRFSRLNNCLAENIHDDGAFEECKALYLDAWRVVRTCRLYLS